MTPRDTSLDLRTGRRRAGREGADRLTPRGGQAGRLLHTSRGVPRDAFTLIELLLVLALLAMAVAVAAPSLSRFFRGRVLDSEARRMLALTHYGQSRAVAEGIPIIVWFRPENHTYGLAAETTYSRADTRAATNQVDPILEIELDDSMARETLLWNATKQLAGNQPAIRFKPDGYVGETSPLWVRLRLTDEDEVDGVWLVLDDNHLNYALQSVQPVIRR